jgi:hypothetical protein
LHLFDVSGDFTSSLWGLGTRTQAPEFNDLYLRTSTGSFVRIGPAGSNLSYFYAGASRDLSHVLLTGASLEEYVGTGHAAPMLVGVAGGRESNALLSDCGIRLGSNLPSQSHGSMYNAVSADGRRIFFTAVGADDAPCAGTEPPVDEVFAREEFEASPGSGELGMRTASVSASECNGDAQCGAAPPADAQFEGASQDGSKVFFASTQELVPGAVEDAEGGDSAAKGCSLGITDCNLYEAEFDTTGRRHLVAVSDGSAQPQVQGVARISEDGSHVYFVAKGDLTGAAVNERGEVAVEGEDNLYVYERDALHPAGLTSFIARLSPGDQGDWSQVDNRPVQTSHDGRYLVFVSSAAPTGEGVSTGGPGQVYEYDAQTGRLTRASIGAGGFNNDGRTPINGPALAVGPGAQALPATAAEASSPSAATATLLPEDGTVFFESSTALTPRALNDRTEALGQMISNVYEYREGSIYLLSDGQDESDSSAHALIGASASGRDVFFTTSDPLIGQDGNTGQDIYDARVQGGFSGTPASGGCSGDACQGQVGASPALPVAGSAGEPAAVVTSSVATDVASKSQPKPKKSRPRKPKRKKTVRRGLRHGKARRAR